MSPSRTLTAARPRPLPWLLAALATLLFLVSATALRAQAIEGNYQVFIDSVHVGNATAVANLPVQGVPAVPSTPGVAAPHQAAAGTQTSVVVATKDPTLLALLHGWVGINNSGTKNTVQPKEVEIDQIIPTGGPIRYVLHGAWPSRFDAPGPDGTIMVTIVYQRAEILHR